MDTGIISEGNFFFLLLLLPSSRDLGERDVSVSISPCFCGETISSATDLSREKKNSRKKQRETTTLFRPRRVVVQGDQRQMMLCHLSQLSQDSRESESESICLEGEKACKQRTADREKKGTARRRKCRYGARTRISLSLCAESRISFKLRERKKRQEKFQPPPPSVPTNVLKKMDDSPVGSSPFFYDF